MGIHTYNWEDCKCNILVEKFAKLATKRFWNALSDLAIVMCVQSTRTKNRKTVKEKTTAQLQLTLLRRNRVEIELA